MLKNTYLSFATIATFLTVFVYLLVLIMRKRIKLVVQLFEEAGKAIINMPVLLIEPLLVNLY